MNAVRRLDRGSQTLGDIAQVIGGEAASALVAALGGKQLYVPATPGPEHPITRVIGPEAAALLAEFYHGTTFTLPITPAKRAQILGLAAGGVRPNDIPQLARVSRSFVYKVLAEARDTSDGHCGDLFGGD